MNTLKFITYTTILGMTVLLIGIITSEIKKEIEESMGE